MEFLKEIEKILPLLLLGTAITQIWYLWFNVIRQKRTEKKLESMLKSHEHDFQAMLESYNKEKKFLHLTGENSKSDFKDIVLMAFVRSQINQLEKRERVMMNKVIERKNTENQIRYVHKLISDIGFNTLLKSPPKAASLHTHS